MNISKEEKKRRLSALKKPQAYHYCPHCVRKTMMVFHGVNSGTVESSARLECIQCWNTITLKFSIKDNKIINA